jgi:hypothetical protein
VGLIAFRWSDSSAASKSSQPCLMDRRHLLLAVPEEQAAVVEPVEILTALV